MIHSSFPKFLLSGLAAVLLASIGALPLSAQTATSKVVSVISDAQAQSLLQVLAAQQSGTAATALTPAQNQMLMQYLLSKNGTSAASTALAASAAPPATAATWSCRRARNNLTSAVTPNAAATGSVTSAGSW